jgi:hypothetical protein
MARLAFAVDTITKDGMHPRGTEAEIDDAYAESLVRLSGVSYVEEPVKKAPSKGKRKKKKEETEDDV